MPFREIKSTGPGKFFKWANPGQEFLGKYVRMGQGEYKGKATFHLVMIDSTTGAEVKVNAPTILKRKVEEGAKPGDTLHIKFVGYVASGNAQPAKDFYVGVDDASAPAAATLPTQAPPPAAPAVPLAPLAVAPLVAPAVPTPAGSDYTSLLALLEKHAGPSYAVMVKMLDRYPTESEKSEVVKLTLRQTFGVQI
jgi:hypothetical protein